MSTEFVLGTAQLTCRYGVINRHDRSSDAASAISLLRFADRLGIAAVDTAPSYGDAESLIGQAAIQTPVHTKFASGQAPLTSLQASLARIGRRHIDVAYFHDSQVALRDPDMIRATAGQVVGAQCERIGVSVYDQEEFRAAIDHPDVSVVQVPISVLDRRFSSRLLEAAIDQHVCVYARSVLLQGVLAASPADLPRSVGHLRSHVLEFQELAREFGVSPLQAAIGWVCSIKGVHGVVLGASTEADLAGCVHATQSQPLDHTMVEALERLPLPEPAAVDPRRWR